MRQVNHFEAFKMALGFPFLPIDLSGCPEDLASSRLRNQCFFYDHIANADEATRSLFSIAFEKIISNREGYFRIDRLAAD
jgi:hypothetical protein